MMNKTILCIEKVPEMTRTANWMMQKHGYDVLWTQSVAEALELVHAFWPSLILLETERYDQKLIHDADNIQQKYDTADCRVRLIAIISEQSGTNDTLPANDNLSAVLCKPVTYSQLQSHLFANLTA